MDKLVRVAHSRQWTGITFELGLHARAHDLGIPSVAIASLSKLDNRISVLLIKDSIRKFLQELHNGP